MLQNSIVVKKYHRKFIGEVAEQGNVWALENDLGFATSSSNHFEDTKGIPVKLICFWSNEKLAKVCAKSGWANYAPRELRLEEFLENWCVGMHNDNLLVGTNFDWNMFGFEIEPLELILELTEELIKIEKELAFKKFEGVYDIRQQTLDAINSQ